MTVLVLVVLALVVGASAAAPPKSLLVLLLLPLVVILVIQDQRRWSPCRGQQQSCSVRCDGNSAGLARCLFGTNCEMYLLDLKIENTPRINVISAERNSRHTRT